MTKYFLAMERTDGSMDEPFHSLTNKRKAISIARSIAKSPSFDCIRIWVDDSEGCGIAKFILPEWKP